MGAASTVKEDVCGSHVKEEDSNTIAVDVKSLPIKYQDADEEEACEGQEDVLDTKWGR